MDAAPSLLPADAGLVLVGYRATGKTTVGRLLAGRLGRPFFDVDEVLETRTGRSIASIFAEGGEAAFREIEAETIRALLDESPGAIIATGGGAVLREENRRRLADHGVVVWLSAPVEVLADRLRSDSGGRPALTSAGLIEEIAAVLAAREPLYRGMAILTVDTSLLAPEAVASSVMAGIDSIGQASGGR